MKLDINRLLVRCWYTSGNFTRKCMKFTFRESKDVLDRKGKVNDTAPKCCHSNLLKCTLPIPPLGCFLMPCSTLLQSLPASCSTGISCSMRFDSEVAKVVELFSGREMF